MNHKETKEKPIVKVSNVNKNVDIRDKIVKITLSDHEMLNSRELKRNQPNFKKLPFKCDTCVLGFMREDTCQMHWNQKHHEVNIFTDYKTFFFLCLFLYWKAAACRVVPFKFDQDLKRIF